MSEPKYCFIQFKLTFNTVPGEEIRVIGNIPELGSWDINKGERMITSKLDYPIWKTKENIKVSQDTLIQYKYVVFKNGIFDKWEILPNNSNRTLSTQHLLRVIVHDIQEVSTSKIEKYTKLSNFESNTDGKLSKIQEDEDERFDFREPKLKKVYFANSPNERISSRLNLLSNIRETMNLNTNNHSSINETEEFPELNYELEEEEYKPSEKLLHKEEELKPTDKIIMCSLYLPYKAVKNENGEWDLEHTNEPFYNTISKLTRRNENIKWIGLLKNFHEIKNENEKDSIISKLQKKHNMYVVKLDQNSTSRLHKLISCFLEPLFHYITISHAIEQIKEFDNMWKAYKEFNELLSKVVSAHLSDNSLIFLHDYHLFLAPSFIYNTHQHFNKTFKNVSIGLFLHSPFPSHDVFRKFPFREEILKSMMNCSIIGFHTFDSSRNFLTSCRRLLLINSMCALKGDLALSYYGRNVIIRVKHVSSTPDFIIEEMKNKLFTQVFDEIRSKFNEKYIFVSMDNLMFLAGVRHKIEGYKRYLREIGDGYKQNVLLQYIDTTEDNIDWSEEEIEDIQKMKENIHDLAQSIKKEFGDDIIQIIEKKISYTERLAVLAAGKCYVKSSKKESFSLDVYEFLNLKILMNDTSEMGYILSELSGVTSSLSGAIKVNPFDVS
jgi:trehalose-6-phosphate synthase